MRDTFQTIWALYLYIHKDVQGFVLLKYVVHSIEIYFKQNPFNQIIYIEYFKRKQKKRTNPFLYISSACVFVSCILISMYTIHCWKIQPPIFTSDRVLRWPSINKWIIIIYNCARIWKKDAKIVPSEWEGIKYICIYIGLLYTSATMRNVPFKKLLLIYFLYECIKEMLFVRTHINEEKKLSHKLWKRKAATKKRVSFPSHFWAKDILRIPNFLLFIVSIM